MFDALKSNAINSLKITITFADTFSSSVRNIVPSFSSYRGNASFITELY